MPFNMILLIILNFVLQTTIFQHLRVFGILPNTTLIILVCISVLKGKKVGSFIGLIVGFIQDILFFNVIGINAFIYFIIGYLIGSINDKIYKDSSFIPFVLTALSTVFYHLAYSFFMYFLSVNYDYLYLLRKIIFIELIYNSLLSVLIYKLVVKLEENLL
ncbi:rod shape-determining protein MreD [Caloranaerobacter azorensis DSM 13643]|uniref:Rod shape-determining protein MreD n=1 Tax=Caloranaerobacter azorensis DSM 13643 TaxID=1121264 RepID=A0A1M5UD08_9FIRM|nr:rod shape-determining protein MreD [Caloranaerobacter azorensis]SHH60847.1 rod shape-determining protein MreD [Caloranaerobacter azorensis DSM 13643]